MGLCKSFCEPLFTPIPSALSDSPHFSRGCSPEKFSRWGVRTADVFLKRARRNDPTHRLVARTRLSRRGERGG